VVTTSVLLSFGSQCCDWFEKWRWSEKKIPKDSMSIASASLDLDAALGALPAVIRKRLVSNYANLKRPAFESHSDALGHQAGKLAEVLLRALQHWLTDTYIPLSTGLRNFKGECEKIEALPKSTGPEGLRILMPRALVFLYSLRNKRDFGHAGGEVDANQIDAATAVRLADWCMCELVRVSKTVPIEDAQLICDAIAQRKLPVVWSVLGRKRILNTSHTYREQTLLLLYSDLDSAIPTEDLFEWTGHSNRGHYRRDVLSALHRTRLIEWDRETDMALISPTGIAEVESRILVQTT
jgi:hypothetical protein